MKKLLTIIVIAMFAVSLFAVDNPFTFSFYDMIKIAAADQSQPGRMQSTDDVNGDSPANDYVVTKTQLIDEVNGSATITIAEIYTLGSYLKGYGEYGLGGDAYRINFSTGMTNGIKAVPDYLTVDINVDWTVRWESRETYASEADLATDINGDGDQVDEFTTLAGQQVDYVLTPSLKLSGGIPDTGFTWSFKEAVEMQFEADDWKDNDPKYAGPDKPADIYNPVTGNIVGGVTEQDCLFGYAEFQTNVTLAWEFFHYFAPENITCTLSLSQDVNVQLPYSGYLEESKRLRTEGNHGVKFGLAGVSLGIFMHLRTNDYLNTSAPLNGDSGSSRDWSGDWLGTTKAWDDAYAISHARGDMRLGPKITFDYTKEWFSFGTSWLGYEDGLRQWDEDGLNAIIKWVNEFEIYGKFSL